MKSKIQGLGCILILLGIIAAIGYFGYNWTQDQMDAVPEATIAPEPTPTLVPRSTSTIVPTITPEPTKTSLPQPTSTIAPAPVEYLDAVVIASWSLKVFENPNYDSLITAWLTEGTELTVTACNGNWAFVGVGWVNSEWLDPDYCEVK